MVDINWSKMERFYKEPKRNRISATEPSHIIKSPHSDFTQEEREEEKRQECYMECEQELPF